MRNTLLILSIVIVGFSSCSEPLVDKAEINPNLIRYGNFENQTLSLDLWSNDGAGEFNIEDLESYEGKFAMHLNPESCMQLFYNEAVYVEKEKLYELSLAIKLDGEQTNCSGGLIMHIFQGEKTLLQFNIDKSNAEQWVVKKYYFTPISDDMLEFEIISGVHNTFLDDVQLRLVGEFN
ncbi:MAG: hypothetical protein IPG60_07795 [Bacteroidetes bacterium]|nr:hypothetical protein [Bacteroidota bacterium]